MDSDSDDYDYLSVLKSGFNSEKCLKKSSHSVINCVDTNSDTYDSDSDDCVIIENEPKNIKPMVTSIDNKPKEIWTPSKPLAEEPAKAVVKESLSKSQDLNAKLDSFTKDIKHLKEDFGKKAVTPPIKSESIDVKPYIEPPDSDIKPFILKIENGVKKEESPDLKHLKITSNESISNESTSVSQTMSNIESIQSNASDSKKVVEINESAEKGSTPSGDNLCLLLSLIKKIRSEHQRPTFDRILCKYKKHDNSEDLSNHKSLLKSLLRDAIERELIEKIEGKDDNVYSYRIVSEKTSKYRKRLDSKSPRKDFVKKQKLCSDVSADFDNTVEHNNPNNIPLCLKSLATEGYTDISDIDITSAQNLFGDTELDPEIFELYQVKANLTPTSFSFNSIPIKSFNHNRNREVISKQLTVNTPNTTPEDIDVMLSLKDYRNWLLEPLPRNTPFIAQPGDRVVYLRDAHKIYIDYELKELRQMYPKFQSTPEEINKTINCDECVIYAIISEVKFYQIKCIKFSVIKLKNMSNENPFEFYVLYRPNRGICDFLVLDYIYNDSQRVDWKAGQEFRSLWKKSWWIGTIVSKSAFDPKYPNSLFKCFNILWNTGETGRLSPWDLFVVDENRRPQRKENGVLIIRDDMLTVNYKPFFNEWPERFDVEMSKWRYEDCRRIYKAIKFIEKRVSPHILSTFMECQNQDIVYPVNLNLFKTRLKNLFYRRKESIIREISFMKTNAKLMVKKTDFKDCEDFVDLLLLVANDYQIITMEQLMTQINKFPNLTENVPQLDAEYPSSSEQECGPTAHYNNPSAPSPPMPRIVNQSCNKQKSPKKRSRNRSEPNTSHSTLSSEFKVTQSTQWKDATQKFIDQLLRNDDSLPYRQPVDPLLFPYYRTVIAEPIDLSDIQKKLTLDEYPNPIQVRKDFRLMFENAKAFSRDSKSKMRIINKKLSTLAEDSLREIIVDWERVYVYEKKTQNSNTTKVREPTSRHQLWGFAYQQYY